MTATAGKPATGAEDATGAVPLAATGAEDANESAALNELCQC